MSDDVLIKVEGVGKKFCRSLKRSMFYGIEDIARDTFGLPPKAETLRKEEFWAVNDVSFELKRGECLGIIGPNGAGKSTLLKMLNGIILPDKGKIAVRGRVGALIEVGAGFHPLLTGRENVYLNGSILGLRKKEIDRKFDEIVAFSELEQFIDMPVKHYSSGMYVRLGFAIAAHIEPEILLIDEVLAVGDIRFQVMCINNLLHLKHNGSTILIVSHSDLHLAQLADLSVLLNYGTLTHQGPTATVLFHYNKLQAAITSNPLPTDSPSIFQDHLQILSFTANTNASGFESEIKVGDQVNLHLQFHSDYDILDTYLVLRFWTSTNILVSVIDSRHQNFLATIKQGTNVIDIIIERIVLSPGVYRISGGVLQYDKFLLWSGNLLRLEIKNHYSLPTIGHCLMNATFSSH